MLQPGRHTNTSDYRYGFQGQEMDDEVKGEGNSLNYTFRMHDPRVGRLFAVDPLAYKFPFYSPYQFSSNTRIISVELEGLESSNIQNEIEKENDFQSEKNESQKNPILNWWKEFTGSDNREIIFPGVDTKNPEGSQNRINTFLNNNQKASDQVKTATEDTKTLAKGLAIGTAGLVLTPIAVTYGAPLITSIGSASGEVILVKMVGSAGGQYIVTGKIDGVDVLADGLLVNGAGEVVGAYADWDLISGDFQAYGFGKTGRDTFIDLGVNAAGGFTRVKNESLMEKTDFTALSEMIYEGIMELVYKATESTVSKEKKEN